MQPRIFIGSSVESLEIAYAIQTNLDRAAEITVWDQGVFDLSASALTTLLKQLDNSDYGIFIFRPEDIATLRGETKNVVRDNVLFEMGLFIGRLGNDRVFFVIPDDVKDFHLPTDLSGITPGRYKPGRSDGNLVAALGAFSSQVRRQISGFINHNASIEQQKKKLINIFGFDISTDFSLIYPKLTLKDVKAPSHRRGARGTTTSYYTSSFDNIFRDETSIATTTRMPDDLQDSNSFPYITADGLARVRVEATIPSGEIQGMVSIAATIAKITGQLPKMLSDEEARTYLNTSYCSLGGATIKTKQLIDSPNNTFYEFAYSRNSDIIDKQDSSTIYAIDEKYDYCILLKIHPRLFQNRVQICVAGIGTWGTQGGCWFLANKWEELEEKFGDQDFGAIVRVEHGFIQSAEIIASKQDSI
jgi:hypothetical protein